MRGWRKLPSGKEQLLRHPRLSKLEDDLEKIQGVTGVRVVGEERPTEIHVVATGGRAAKQIVRDVQSLTTTNLGEPIDHRIVSVVQLDEAPPIASTNGHAHRAILEQVVTASKGPDGWVRVTLRMPDATRAEGAVMAGPSRDERARGAVWATVRALKGRLDGLGARLDVENIAIAHEGPAAVHVRANMLSGGSKTLLMGSAAIEDDVATAAARALLHALNRKLS